MRIAACLKLVPLRPDVDPLTGETRTDPRELGASAADHAALEWALRLAQRWGGDVLAVTAGPPAAEPLLREALAAGATRAARVDLPPMTASAGVADALAGALRGADIVVCGDHSLDRGSGSVPAFLAGRLDAAQALGLLSLDPGEPGALAAQRRLDGGRRERLRVAAPAVLSVEPGDVRLRRAALAAVVDARDARIELTTSTGEPMPEAVGRVAPYRPRARVLPPPSAHLDARRRVLALTGALADRTPPQVVTAPPAEAADALLDYLRRHGFL